MNLDRVAQCDVKRERTLTPSPSNEFSSFRSAAGNFCDDTLVFRLPPFLNLPPELFTLC